MLNQQALYYGKVKSGIRQLFEIGREKKRIFGEENVFDFSLGNPSVPPPEEVKAAFLDALETQAPLSLHGYTTAPGDNECRDAIAKDFTERYGEEFTRWNFYMTCGATAAIISCLKAFVTGPESEVVVLAPYFPEYRTFIDSCGAKTIVVPPDFESFQINLAALEDKLTVNTRCVIINTPNNPTGVIYTRENLEGMAEILRAKNKEFGHPIYVISDEPYRELVYGDCELPFIPRIYNNTIICYSFSKCLSIPGDRIGYMCAPSCMDDVDDVMAATAGAARCFAYVCAPAIMQQVIKRCAAVRPDLAPYEFNRALIYEGLTKIGYECVYPDGAFYLFIKAPNGNSKLFSAMAQDENLLIVPADEFGCPGYLRVSYCVDADMIERSLPVFQKVFERCKNR